MGISWPLPPADGGENQRYLRGTKREETHEEGVSVHRVQLRERWGFKCDNMPKKSFASTVFTFFKLKWKSWILFVLVCLLVSRMPQNNCWLISIKVDGKWGHWPRNKWLVSDVKADPGADPALNPVMLLNVFLTSQSHFLLRFHNYVHCGKGFLNYNHFFILIISNFKVNHWKYQYFTHCRHFPSGKLSQTLSLAEFKLKVLQI